MSSGHTIICKNCRKVLERGINPPIYKMCIECVRKTTPAAPGGLRGANGKRLGEKPKPKEMKISIETEMYTLEPEDPEKETLVVMRFVVSNYFKNKLLNFEATFEEVTMWYEEMSKIHAKYNHKGDKNEL